MALRRFELVTIGEQTQGRTNWATPQGLFLSCILCEASELWAYVIGFHSLLVPQDDHLEHYEGMFKDSQPFFTNFILDM